VRHNFPKFPSWVQNSSRRRSVLQYTNPSRYKDITEYICARRTFFDTMPVGSD
jgi:hypothetical protein